MVLDVGLAVGASEHQILFRGVVEQLGPERDAFSVGAGVALIPHDDSLSRIVGQVHQSPPAATTLDGGVGSDELSPGLLHDLGPDLARVPRVSIDGERALPGGRHGNVVVDRDEGILTINVEFNGVGASFVDHVSDEEVFEGTRPRVEHDHGGDEVAISEGALLG